MRASPCASTCQHHHTLAASLRFPRPRPLPLCLPLPLCDLGDLEDFALEELDRLDRLEDFELALELALEVDLEVDLVLAPLGLGLELAPLVLPCFGFLDDFGGCSSFFLSFSSRLALS